MKDRSEGRDVIDACIHVLRERRDEIEESLKTGDPIFARAGEHLAIKDMTEAISRLLDLRREWFHNSAA